MPEAITLYHNPACSKSREALAHLRERGYAPRIIEYLKTPLDKAALKALQAQMGVPVQAMLRTKADVYAELDLGNRALDEDALLDLLAAHPSLLERPVVASAKGARLARPLAAIEDILP